MNYLLLVTKYLYCWTVTKRCYHPFSSNKIIARNGEPSYKLSFVNIKRQLIRDNETCPTAIISDQICVGQRRWNTSINWWKPLLYLILTSEQPPHILINFTRTAKDNFYSQSYSQTRWPRIHCIRLILFHYFVGGGGGGYFICVDFVRILICLFCVVLFAAGCDNSWRPNYYLFLCSASL
jgi:hypothetical protein